MDRFIERAERSQRTDSAGWRCLGCGIVPSPMVTTPFARWRKQVSRTRSQDVLRLAVPTPVESPQIERPAPAPLAVPLRMIKRRSGKPVLRLVSNPRPNAVTERLRAMDRQSVSAYRLQPQPPQLRLVPPGPAQEPNAVPVHCVTCQAELHSPLDQREHQAVCQPGTRAAAKG
ncbi:MAG: hypothetical protein ABIR88_03190 [Nitrospiria bacterium]